METILTREQGLILKLRLVHMSQLSSLVPGLYDDVSTAWIIFYFPTMVIINIAVFYGFYALWFLIPSLVDASPLDST
jgi:hypothetical protein